MNDTSTRQPLAPFEDRDDGSDNKGPGLGAVLLGAGSAMAAFPLAALSLQVGDLASNAVLFALSILAVERLYRGLRGSYVKGSALALVLALAATAMGYNAGLAGSAAIGLDTGVDAPALP